MSWQLLLGFVALPLVCSAAVGLLLLRHWIGPQATPQPAVPDNQDVVVAELAGLLRRHLDMLPRNYDAIPDWEYLVEDTVRTLTRHKLAPVAKLAAERQCATTH